MFLVLTPAKIRAHLPGFEPVPLESSYAASQKYKVGYSLSNRGEERSKHGHTVCRDASELIQVRNRPDRGPMRPRELPAASEANSGRTTPDPWPPSGWRTLMRIDPVACSTDLSFGVPIPAAFPSRNMG